MLLKECTCKDIKCCICPFKDKPCELYFIHNPKLTFGELAKAMKKDGKFLMIESNRITLYLNRKLDSYIRKYARYRKG